MIPNSDTLNAIAVTSQPDWSQGVSTSFLHRTSIYSSRSSKEQRSRGRRSPKARISWTVSGLNNTQAFAAMAAASVEMQSMCLVPFWTEGTITITTLATGGTSLTIGVDPRRDWFAVGQYICLDNGLLLRFRQIAAVTDRILTLTADGTGPTFAIGSRVYPCRTCRRLPDEQSMVTNDTTCNELKLSYETTT